MVINHSATTGVHYGTHNLILFSEISHISHVKGFSKATSVQHCSTIYSAMYQSFFLSTVIYLFAWYTSINYFKSLFCIFPVTCNAIQSIVISTEYFYISFSYIIWLSMSCHHIKDLLTYLLTYLLKDHTGNKGLLIVMLSLVLGAWS